MSPLAQKIADAIRAGGPLRVDRYWDLALFDREHGYYSAAEPFGRAGDFVTAPEISQMFGELVGAWIASAWRELGSPSPFVLAEIGPGRGTLMADILRTIRSVAPDCLRAAKIRLVETSDRLAAVQTAALERFDLPVRRLRRIEHSEDHTMVVVANELFDAVPARQFVFEPAGWRERCVTLDPAGRFEFALCDAEPQYVATIDGLGLPAPIAGAILELAPARERLAHAIAARLAGTGGAGLFIDYGHGTTGYGDTLQAVSKHSFADPLERPGEHDVTSHVDFARLAPRFAAEGLCVAPLSGQGEFLTALGLLERAGALGHGEPQAGRDRIIAAVERLAGTGPNQMGSLFKVLAVASEPLDLPPFVMPAG